MGRNESERRQGTDSKRRAPVARRRWGAGLALVAAVTLAALVAIGAIEPSGGAGDSDAVQSALSSPDSTDGAGSPVTETSPQAAPSTLVDEPVPTTTVAPTTTAGATPLLDRPFAETSPFNAPINDDPVLDPRSSQMTAFLAQKVVANLYEFGIAIYDVDQTTNSVSVDCTAPWGRCPLEDGLHRVPDRARPAPGNDGTLVVIDWSERRTIEMWQAIQTSVDAWRATWGTTTSIDGTGIPEVFGNGSGVSHLAGVIRVEEIERGRIDHALAFSTNNPCRGIYRYPATKTDGASDRDDCIPEGARIQLNPAVDVGALNLTSAERTIARALQTYGAYVVDAGGTPMAFYFEIAPDAGSGNPGSVYVGGGLTLDYFSLHAIPWEYLRVLNAWDGS